MTMNHDITSCVMPVPENSLRFFISVNVYVTTDDYVVTDLNFWHGYFRDFSVNYGRYGRSKTFSFM